MHGLGNDFAVFDAINQNVKLSQTQIIKLAQRHRGIGFDQLLIVEEPSTAQADFSYRIFNADGNEVEQCGNGARCFAKFVQQQQLSSKQELTIATKNSIIKTKLLANGKVSVAMGVPNFAPQALPFLQAQNSDYELKLESATVRFGAVSIGNPHAVLCVDDLKNSPILEIAPQIQAHADFPNSVNVGFMQIVDKKNILLRVYERGAGETQACGSGACAAVAVGIKSQLLEQAVTVRLQGGELEIDWSGEGSELTMTGAATTVYQGQFNLHHFS